MTTSFPAALDEFPSARPETLASSNPVPAKRFTDLGDAIEAIEARIGVGTGSTRSNRMRFVEGDAAGTHDASVSLPAGSMLIDIIVAGVSLWASAGDSLLTVGDTDDPDGFYTGVDLEATDLLAGESLSFALAGGKAGAYIANSQVTPRYYPTGTDIVASVLTDAAGGEAGETIVDVIWSIDSDPTVATFTAAE